MYARTTTLAIAMMMAVAADAGASPRRLQHIKFGAQNPAVHGARVLQAPVRARQAEMAGCGTIEGTSDAVPVRLHVAAAGTVDKVEVTRRVPPEVETCLARVLGTIHYPARRRASVVGFVLIYE